MKGHIQKLDDHVWRIYVDVGRDPITGRRRRLTRTVRGTKKAAEAEAARMVGTATDRTVATNAITVGGLLDAWLEHATLAPWTRRTYTSKIEVHVRPALGDVKLAKLTTARLDALYRELLERGRLMKNGKRAPLSAQSVKHVHTIIRAACTQAEKWQWIDRNPAKLASPPPVAARADDLPPIAAILTIFEKLTIDMRDLAFVAIVTGARRGELCGLRWTDINLETGEVRIERAAVDLQVDQPVTFKTTKTGKPRRLAIDALTIAVLNARHARQAEKALAVGTAFDPAGYVFSDAAGAREALRPMLVTERWRNAALSAGVKCTFHGLRHLSVTELLEAGFEVGGVAKRVGHASTKMTSDRYQHARRSGDLAAAQHLAGLLAPESAVKVTPM